MLLRGGKSLCLTEITRFPDYTCVQNLPIGEGSSGTAYLVKKNGTKFVMKVSQNDRGSQRELLVMRQLQGAKYVVQLEDNFQDYEKSVLIMTYGEGGTMDAFSERHDYFQRPHHRFSFMRKLVRGLAEIHARGVVHADLKGTNVAVDANFDPLIFDFDLSVDVNTSFKCVGTFVYMAPEVTEACRQGGSVVYTPAVDFFAWGMVMYRLFEKELPFKMKAPEYYKLMSSAIKFHKEDLVDFYENVFAVVKPLSSRAALQRIEDNIDQAVLKPRPETLDSDMSYILNDFADEDEKAYKVGGKFRYLLIWGSILGVVLFFGLFVYLKNRVDFSRKDHKPQPETSISTQIIE